MSSVTITQVLPTLKNKIRHWNLKLLNHKSLAIFSFFLLLSIWNTSGAVPKLQWGSTLDSYHITFELLSICFDGVVVTAWRTSGVCFFAKKSLNQGRCSSRSVIFLTTKIQREHSNAACHHLTLLTEGENSRMRMKVQGRLMQARWFTQKKKVDTFVTN